jgi:hypothetical protein
MGGKTIDRHYDAPANKVFEACRRAMSELGYTMISSDSAGLSISFNTGRSMKTWAGQDLSASVFADSNGSKLVIGGSLAKGGNPLGGGSQIGSWGEKAALSEKFHDSVARILPTLPDIEQPASGTPDLAEQLTKLTKLHADGLLTDEDLKAAKNKLLS